MKLRYLDPGVNEVVAPSLAFIEQLIRHAPAQYWRYQTCIGTLEPIDATGPQLTFTVQPHQGVLVRYCTVDGSDEFVLTHPRAAADDGEISIFYGGDQWLVPHSYFVPVELALSAIAEFIGTQQRLAGARWIVLGLE